MRSFLYLKFNERGKKRMTNRHLKKQFSDLLQDFKTMQIKVNRIYESIDSNRHDLIEVNAHIKVLRRQSELVSEREKALLDLCKDFEQQNKRLIEQQTALINLCEKIEKENERLIKRQYDETVGKNENT